VTVSAGPWTLHTSSSDGLASTTLLLAARGIVRWMGAGIHLLEGAPE
jgi:hypothetical protein